MKFEVSVITLVCLVTCFTLINGLERSINEDLSYDEMIKAAQDVYKDPMTKPDVLLHALRNSFMNFGGNVLNLERNTRSGKLSESFASDLATESSPELCFNHTNFAMNELMQGKEWALRMFDAVDKFPSGFLDGNTAFLGSYDECERIYSNNTVSVRLPPFRGKYCLIYANLPASIVGEQGSVVNPPLLKFGICLADSCGNAEATLLAYNLLAGLPNNTLQVLGAVCQERFLDFDAKAIVMLIFCGILIFLLTCGTAYDVIFLRWTPNENDEKSKNRDEYISLGDEKPKPVPHLPGTIGHILLAFSLYTNSSKLLSAKTSAGTLTSINGIRVISMTWVILGHTLAFGISYSVNSWTYMSQMLKRWSFMAIVNAEVAVDTFFALSGLLVGYLTLKEMKKNNGRLNFAMFYFHRFWRLTPAYMLILGVYHALSPYWFDGPEWNQQGMEYQNCHDNWWTNLLYVNNFVNADRGCMAWSWYLANDMQFFVLSPLLFVPLYYSTVLGLVGCGVLLLATTIAPFIVSYAYDLPPSMFGGLDPPGSGTFDYFTVYYVKPYCRMGPYIVGMVTGYILYKTKCKVKLNVFVNLFGWVLATGLALVTLYGVHEPLNGSPMSVGVSALFNATHKTVWAACICWVIFACSTGNGGYVNTFLSWEAYTPLGRLTYCAYLVHPILMYTYYFGLRSHFYLWDLEVIMMYFGFLVWSYCVAYITSLVFESPMMGLEKVFFRRNGEQKQNKH